MVTSNKVDFTVASSVVSKVEALLSQFHDTENEIAKSKEKSRGLMVSALALLVPHMIEKGTEDDKVKKELRKVIRGGKKAEKIPSKENGIYFSKSTEDKVLDLLCKKPFITECEKVQDLEKLQEYFITNHKCNGFNAIYALYHPVDEEKQIERLLKQIAKFKDNLTAIKTIATSVETIKTTLEDKEKQGIKPPTTSTATQASDLKKAA